MPRKRKYNKRSQKFSLLAHRRWSKVAGNDNNIVEPEDHVAAVTGEDKQVDNSASIISSCLMTEHDEQARTESIADLSTETITDLSLEYSNEQVIAEAITDETESTITVNETESTVTVNETETEVLTNETQEWIVAGYPENCQSGCHKEEYTNRVDEVIENDSNDENESNDEVIENNSNDDFLSSSTISEVSSSEYCPTPMKRAKVNPVELGNRIFICQTTQLNEFLNQVNTTSLCYTPNCAGKLIPIYIKHVGLGGSILVKFSCTGCSERMLNLSSSAEIEFSRRSACSLAMQVAFIAAGCMHAQYSKVLKQYLGISAVNSTTFYETIKLLDPIVATLLTEMCTAAKDEMKSQDPSTVGSWQRAVTTSDGAWLTRGRFSQNCTFTIRNYINNSLLYFVHLCMRGADKDKLYLGTAKGAEGFAASLVFKAAKEEGMHIEIQWQDGDSSSNKSFREYYPDEE